MGELGVQTHPDPGTSHGARAWVRAVVHSQRARPPLQAPPPAQPERLVLGLLLRPLPPLHGKPPEPLIFYFFIWVHIVGAL